MSRGALHVGTSGWSYDHWRGVLYPAGVGKARWLDVYAGEFDTVEVNASFYHWPRASTFASWRDRLPDGFVLSVKAPRGLTHARTLADPERWTDRLAEGMRTLGTHAGPLLFQLPPDLARDDGRLAALLAAVPDGVRAAVELRHPSWYDDGVYRMLEEHGASLCVVSGAHVPCVLRATSDLVYVRLHGPDPERLYVGGYPDADLRWWADRIGEWRAQGRTVVVYFNNDDAGHAVRDAKRLRELAA